MYSAIQLISIVLFRDDIQDELSVFPTVVVKMTDSIVNAVALVYFEKRLISECSSLLQAAVTVFSLYYVFDVRFPTSLGNTINFLDVFVGGVDEKTKVRPAVQRRINNLHADWVPVVKLRIFMSFVPSSCVCMHFFLLVVFCSLFRWTCCIAISCFTDITIFAIQSFVYIVLLMSYNSPSHWFVILWT